MKQPPYNLRPNKAADRLTLIDAIRFAVKPENLNEYTYYSMGGPTLEILGSSMSFIQKLR